jgi:hypothetical protein
MARRNPLRHITAVVLTALLAHQSATEGAQHSFHQLRREGIRKRIVVPEVGKSVHGQALAAGREPAEHGWRSTHEQRSCIGTPTHVSGKHAVHQLTVHSLKQTPSSCTVCAPLGEQEQHCQGALLDCIPKGYDVIKSNAIEGRLPHSTLGQRVLFVYCSMIRAMATTAVVVIVAVFCGSLEEKLLLLSASDRHHVLDITHRGWQ